MAALPSPNQVAGSHIGIYEAYYNIVDPGGRLGSVGASDAARFLKRSGLPDGVLGRVWDLSDPTGKGALDRTGFFVALKLVSLAQNGKEVSMAVIMTDSPPPKMGDIPVNSIPNNIIPPSIAGTINSGSEWSIKPAEKSKYDQLFESLRPVNGMLPGSKVKGVMLNSKLPMDTLGKIWDLADMDKDGMLNRHEFTVAMHLVYKALDKHSIPNVLPPELAPPKNAEVVAHNNNNHLVMGLDANKPPVVNPPAKPPIINSTNAMPTAAPVASVLPSVTPALPNWVVSAEERSKFDVLFRQTDIDRDGFVSGAEIRDVFLRYNVPQPVLARIWNLCDTKQLGKLNSEQFALAMWLIGRKLQGVDPPAVLTPEMVPPTMRPKPATANSNANSGTAPGETNAVPYSNPELEMIGKEIEELVKEKHQLESDIAQKEADIKIKSGEIKSLQSELDTLAATLKQLENQKGEAQKRLNDLSTQKTSLEREITEIKLLLEEEQAQVDKLLKEAEEQEANVKAQEEEVGARRKELEGLRQEEANLEGQLQGSKARVEDLTKHLQDAQLQISQAKAKISVLEEQKRRMGDAIATLDSAISTGDVSVVTQSVEEIAPDDFRDTEVAKLIGANVAEPTDTSAVSDVTSNEPDAFGAARSNGPVSMSSLSDSFKDDPFKGGSVQSSNDPFGSSDPFGASFPAQAADGFSSDPFGSFGNTGSASNDPFDPFHDSSGNVGSKTPVDMSGKDPFGCDPFAAVPSGGSNGHTPPPTAPRPESPTPALPPKKSRQPPPRPAPPKHLAGSGSGATRAAPQPPLPTPSPVPGPPAAGWGDAPSSNPQDPFGADPFTGSNSGGGGGFADFANFDGKFSGKADDHSISRGEAAPVSAAWMAQPKQDSSVKSLPVKSDSASPAPSANRYSELEFTEDPFRDYRYEDPFEMEDPFADELVIGGQGVKAGDDPFCATRQSSSSSTDSPAFGRHRGPQLPPPPVGPDEGAPPPISLRMAVSSSSSA